MPDGRKQNGYAVGREVFPVDWKEFNALLGLPGQRQPVCTRTFFVPLREDLAPKPAQVHYYATSLPPHRASASRLGRLIRGHWRVENQLHHVKDRTLTEDRHWVKNPATARSLAFPRSLTASVPHRLKIPRRSWPAHCPEKIEYLQSDAPRPPPMVCGLLE